jgi:subtilisin family serine protease
VRVLGATNKGSGELMAAGLRWAVQEGYRVINLSLSTTKAAIANVLHDLADSAYFRRAAIIASAHNRAVESYPWRFSSVISVGSHELAEPLSFFYNPTPPVEFYARGVDLEVAWLGGGTVRSDGNSFATAHISGICALIVAKHPELTAFELKSVLYLIANNVAQDRA